MDAFCTVLRIEDWRKDSKEIRMLAFAHVKEGRKRPLHRQSAYGKGLKTAATCFLFLSFFIGACIRETT